MHAYYNNVLNDHCISHFNPLHADIDECSENGITAICPEGSRCINTNGSYTCVCNEGYFHLRTENLNECEGKLIAGMRVGNYSYS